MALCDKGKFVNDDSWKGKFMMPEDDDMYCKKVTLLNEDIMEQSRNNLQKQILEFEKSKSMMPVEDDMTCYTEEIREHAQKVFGGGGCLKEYTGVVADTEDGEKRGEVMKYKLYHEHVCEKEVHLDNNIGKLSHHDLVEMQSEAMEKGMNDHVPDEIDGVLNHGGDELVAKAIPMKGRRCILIKRMRQLVKMKVNG
ncbi:hypothetical protein Tco_0505221 [Tanacetum coccineum]